MTLRGTLARCLLVFAFAVAIVTVFVLVQSRPSMERIVSQRDIALVSDDGAMELGSRPIYRHSVIPGGAYSSAELVAATRTDSVVFAVYGPVATTVHARTVGGSRRAYMSYRIGNDVYWTKKKLLLNAGETTLTSG